MYVKFNPITTLSMTAAIAFTCGTTLAQTVSSLQGPTTGNTRAHDINNLGQVVGINYTDTSENATVWDASGVGSNLGSIDGYDRSYGYALNNLGQIVGYSEVAATGTRTATLWDNGRITDLSREGSNISYSVARDINDLGTIVGAANTGGIFANGFVMDTNGLQIAGTQYMGGSNLGVNNSNAMVGHSFFFGDPDTASFATPDNRGGYQTQDLGPSGFNFSLATAVNDNGMSVGHTSWNLTDGWQAAIFSHSLDGPVGFPTLLGTLDGLNTSEANDVNNNGMVVGYSWDGTHSGLESRAWAWNEGVMYDLNDLLADDSQFALLIEATGINDFGDIVGYGLLNDGSVSAFVIEGFVPAPGTAGLLALTSMFASRRRRS